MKKTKVKEDHIGIFVRAEGVIARPGEVRGYKNTYNMTDGGLKLGDEVKVRNVGSTAITKLVTSEGIELHWHMDEAATEILDKKISEISSQRSYGMR